MSRTNSPCVWKHISFQTLQLNRTHRGCRDFFQSGLCQGTGNTSFVGTWGSCRFKICSQSLRFGTSCLLSIPHSCTWGFTGNHLIVVDKMPRLRPSGLLHCAPPCWSLLDPRTLRCAIVLHSTNGTNDLQRQKPNGTMAFSASVLFSARITLHLVSGNYVFVTFVFSDYMINKTRKI